MPDSGAAGNTLKLVGEVILPGASNLVDGDIKTGTAHLLLGVAARFLLGSLGLLLVQANSFSYSVSEKNLLQHVGDVFSSVSSSGGNVPPAQTEPE